MILRAGILGLGVGESHIAGYHGVPGCTVSTLCDADDAKLAEVAARHPELRSVNNPLEVLDDPDIDIVSIATWDDAHAEQIVRAIGNGKHVFAEKPLCLNESELRRIRDALNKRPDVRLSSNLLLRVSPRFRVLRDKVRQGELGTLYYMEADYNYGRIHKIINGWRGRIPYYSVFLGGAVHLVDLLLWMTGWRVKEVSACGNKISTSSSDFRFNDFTVALLTFENGAIAKVSANFACVSSHFHRLLLYGTDATFENFPENGRITCSRDVNSATQLIDLPYPGIKKSDLLEAFVRNIMEGGIPDPCVVSQEEVFETMSVCLAVEAAVQQGKAVPVHYY